MKILDKKFLKFWPNFLFQCLLATASVFIVLLFLGVLYEKTVIASFGATVFIMFLSPEAKESRVRNVIGGHIIGITTGGIFNIVLKKGLCIFLNSKTEIDYIILGALAVGFSMLFMSILNMEHPPAAGLALGLVVEGFTFTTIIVIVTGIVALLILKALLKKYLITLL